MELVDVTPTALQRRTCAVWVPWRDLAVQQRRRGRRVRALAPGDDVMLRVDGETVCRGWVLRSAYAGDEGAYVIVFGAGLSRRVPVEEESRPQPPVPPQVEPRVQDVVVRTVPQQRRPDHDRRRVNLYL